MMRNYNLKRSILQGRMHRLLIGFPLLGVATTALLLAQQPAPPPAAAAGSDHDVITLPGDGVKYVAKGLKGILKRQEQLPVRRSVARVP